MKRAPDRVEWALVSLCWLVVITQIVNCAWYSTTSSPNLGLVVFDLFALVYVTVKASSMAQSAWRDYTEAARDEAAVRLAEERRDEALKQYGANGTSS